MGMNVTKAQLEEARAAMRHELECRGLSVASDTLALRRDLYIIGERDSARALFEFKASVREACDTMYQGHWTAAMPPRFAVLPESEASSPELEILEQIRVVPVFFTARDGALAFRDLDALLDAHLTD